MLNDFTQSRSSGIARKTAKISWAPSGWFISYDVHNPATSFHVFTCPDDFYAVRLGFANTNATPFSISKVMASPSTALTDFANPAGLVEWVPVTFANGGADDDHLVTNGRAFTQVVVEGTATTKCQSGRCAVPSWTWSDWVPIVSKPRTDWNDGPRAILIRVLLPGGETITQPNGGFGGYVGEPAVNFGFEHAAGWLPGDFVSFPTREIPNVSDVSFGIARATVACVQFLTKNRGLVGMSTGDSHHQGTTTTTQFLNYHLRSTIALGSRHVGRLPLGYVSTAAGGATSETFFAALASLIPAIQPSFVVFPGWTYNDCGQEQADESAVDIFIARLIKAADACILGGIVPIFLTPFPRGADSITPKQIEPWRKLRKIITDMGQSGALVVDATSILGQQAQDGIFDGSYLPGLSNDGVHPNNAGHAALGHKLTSMMARLAGMAE